MRFLHLLYVCFVICGGQSLKIPGANNDALPARTRCMVGISHPVHGYLHTRNQKDYYESGDIVVYVCNRGYDLIGNYRLECLRNGEWDHPEPTCQIKSCGRPDELLRVKHSSIVDYETKHFTYLEKAIIKCDDWYKLFEGIAAWRCEDNKKWVADDNNSDMKMPVCRPKCGLRLVLDDLLAGLVSGGKPVKLHGGWPWMAFIDLGRGRAGDHFCGGTLVDEFTVVTAAHCLMSVDVDETVDVWLGLLNRKTDNFNFTQRFTVSQSKIYLHPSFDINSNPAFDFDIAILKLDNPVNFSYWVHPICVPKTTVEKALPDVYRKSSRNAVVIGWGKTERGILSSILLKTRVPLVNRTTCSLSYSQEFGSELIISENMICAGRSNGANDACGGDGGGPLMTKIERIWYLSGVVSFGDSTKKCGRAETYGGYTDVGKMETFIAAHME